MNKKFIMNEKLIIELDDERTTFASRARVLVAQIALFANIFLDKKG
jgi:hypothetical protein